MPNKERLLKLANHLLYSQLGHEIFDFNHYNKGEGAQSVKNKCGTAGCAIGECPIVWPEHWEFDGNGFPVLKDYGSPTMSGLTFFEISRTTYEELFMPTGPYSTIRNGPKSNATKEEVANNIIKYCNDLE